MIITDSQGVVLLPPPNDPYASDEEVGDDDVGLVGNIDLPADVTEILKYNVKMMMKHSVCRNKNATKEMGKMVFVSLKPGMKMLKLQALSRTFLN